jgi:hypothetical protein
VAGSTSMENGDVFKNDNKTAMCNKKIEKILVTEMR